MRIYRGYTVKSDILGDIKSLSPEKSPIAMKDTKWYTHNSTVGFLAAGELHTPRVIYRTVMLFVLFFQEYGIIDFIQCHRLLALPVDRQPMTY